MSKTTACLLRVLTVGCVLLALACTKSPEKEPPSDEMVAGGVAVECYEALYRGQPETFLDHRADASQMPQSFREEMLTCYRNHVAQVNDNRQGVRDVSFSRAQKDESLQLMQVFLRLTYGDGTKEEIVVPMVEKNGDWMMK